MPARDLYHGAVKNALIKDGWTITHDPFTLSFGARNKVLDSVFAEPIARPAVEDLQVLLIGFDLKKEEIVKWIN
ncbi:MAG: hypothetical protein L0215_12945 [Gemmataceae bacterium]|nr:hypothetical protein [Gemmataceae bacterium]